MDIVNSLYSKWINRHFGNITAFNAYTLTRFGMKADIKQVQDKIINGIDDLMKSKFMYGSFSLVYSIEDIPSEVLPDVIKHYTTLGFTCFVLDNTVDERIDSIQLYVSWKVFNRK